ncbi:MAG: 30S ribosomal protein S5 [Planctomycetaceae bacterium]|nr:30S ribosomal protein S5 [Planctomycetaceae bacterium]
MAIRIDPRDINLGEEKVVKINRTSATVKGGRRFSFTGVVVIGDEKGVVGWATGKAREVPNAVDKAVRNARKNLWRVPLYKHTIPHEVVGKFGASSVKLMPAAPGTGIIAGAVVRAVLESVGVHDVLTKVYGSHNEMNLVQAVFDALLKLRSKKEIEELRGVKLS